MKTMMNAVSFVDAKPKIVRTGKPTPEPNEVLVKVAFSALDSALEPVIRKTFVGKMLHKPTNPLFCGWHFSGTVEAIGSQVSSLKPGTQVFGHLPYASTTIQGSLSEYITVASEAVAATPKGINLDMAAASTTEPLTALQALRDVGRLPRNGGRVLVNGAGGQVGSCAVQIARALGSEVTAICSTKDVDKVTRLGAKTVIDRRKTPNVLAELAPAQFDVVFDTPGKLSARKVLRILKPRGVLVNPSPDDMLDFLVGKLFALFTSKSVSMIIVESKTKDLEQIGTWLTDGSLGIDVDSVHEARSIAAAIDRQNHPSKQGRVVVRVEGGFAE